MCSYMNFFCLLLLSLLICIPLSVHTQEQSVSEESSIDHGIAEQDLSSFSLEELMNIQVTSVSKKEQSVSNAPAAVFVITQEDIRRSGVTSVPDALRMVPGINVAQIDSNKWAVSARGFVGRFSNKILVMIDGRTVYTTLFSGTFWENHDLLLEDIERIEVIRGPGATLWGANAMNGVINIITKHAEDTQGGLVSMRTGSEETAIAGIRYGDTIGDDTYYRWYVKNRTIDDLVFADGSDAMDEWQQNKMGFRLDSQLTDTDTLMFQSNVMHEDTNSNGIGFSGTPPYTYDLLFDNETNIFDLSTRWERDLGDEESLALQLFYTWDDRQIYDFKEMRHTVDLDFQHRFPLFERHEILWGAGYRFTTDEIVSTPKIIFFDSTRDLHLFSFFVQDEITLIEDELELYLGTKIEHNDFTGVEIQPNARLIWTLNESNTFWASVSRAVRTPARSDQRAINNLLLIPPDSPLNPFQLPALARGVSTGIMTESEDIIAFELGYRSAWFEKVTVDAAVFYNVYDQIINGSFGNPFVEDFVGTPVLVIPFPSIYNEQAETYGFELSVDYSVTDWWSLKPAYTYYQAHFKDEIEFADIKIFEDHQFHQVSFRSQMNFPHDIELDLWLRYMDNFSLQNVSSYLVLDARVGWKPKENIDVSVGFQNGLDSQHPEFTDPIFDSIKRSEVEHKIYAQVTVTF